MIKQYEENYAVRDKQDVLAMCALQFASQSIHSQISENQEVEEITARLERLNENQLVQLDEERKAAMVSNLLVVLCGNHDAQPIVNTGSLY